MATAKIRPNMGILELFPNQRYEIWVALGEFVDNSIQSFIEHKTDLVKLHGSKFKAKISIDLVEYPEPQIIIQDNAAGIFERDIETAFTPAVRRRNRDGLGQFGIGMKSASGWFSNHYEIQTAALGESVMRSVVFDIPAIVDNDLQEIEIVEAPKLPEEHGTRIHLKNLHQPIPAGNTLGKVRRYIASIYREILRAGQIEIHIAGERISFQEVEILVSEFVNAKQDRIAESEQIWRRNFEFSLAESFANDSAPNKPESPPVVHGWIGIADVGKSHGLALIWRGKVVSGAGASARGDTDIYIPQDIFGQAGNFPYKRLLGECDISNLEVTSYKDSIKWRPGQEAEFTAKLRELFDAQDPYSFRQMASNYRSTAKGDEIESKVQSTVEKAAQSVFETIQDALSSAEISFDLNRELFPRSADSKFVEGKSILFRDAERDANYYLEVIADPEVTDLVKMTQVGENFYIVLNRSHVFVLSYANLPDEELDAVLRVCLSAALAQIKIKNLGVEGWYLFLEYFNEYIRTSQTS